MIVPAGRGEGRGRLVPVPHQAQSVDRFPVGTIQNPLTPAQSINCIQSPDGTKVQLWASEEMDGNIKYVQHMTFDERGRVWAVEPMSYPNTIRAAGATASITDNKFQGGTDRIVIMEDTDGDHGDGQA